MAGNEPRSWLAACGRLAGSFFLDFEDHSRSDTIPIE